MISYNSFEVINNHTSQGKLHKNCTCVNKIHGKSLIECIIHAQMALCPLINFLPEIPFKYILHHTFITKYTYNSSRKVFVTIAKHSVQLFRSLLFNLVYLSFDGHLKVVLVSFCIEIFIMISLKKNSIENQ